jgi:hypothetical protein
VRSAAAAAYWAPGHPVNVGGSANQWTATNLNGQLVSATWSGGGVVLLPLGGFESARAETLSGGARLLDRARHMVLPVTCYVIGGFAVLTLMMKNSLLEQIQRLEEGQLAQQRSSSDKHGALRQAMQVAEAARGEAADLKRKLAVAQVRAAR